MKNLCSLFKYMLINDWKWQDGKHIEHRRIAFVERQFV